MARLTEYKDMNPRAKTVVEGIAKARGINSLIDLACVNGIIPLLQEQASFNWHSKAAIARWSVVTVPVVAA